MKKVYITVTAILTIALISMFYVNHMTFKSLKATSERYIETMNENSKLRIDNNILRSINEELNEQLNSENTEVSSRPILLTAYHTGDGSSGTTTASGLSTKDFQTNDKGWYTYDGKIVMATPNLERINLPLLNGYRAYKDNDLIEFEYEGSIYQGIVLDVCGACYGVAGETEQRYDIFTNGVGIGKKPATIIEEEN